MRSIALFILVFLLAFTATALGAAGLAPEDGSVLDLLAPIVDAFRGGNYPLGGALAIVLAVALARRYGTEYIPWLGTKAGAALMVLVGSFGGALAAALSAPGAVLSFAMVKSATAIAVGAAGGYTLIKDLVVDPLTRSAWYRERAPGWLKAIVSVVLWVFRSPSPVARAEAAGQAAVDAKPPSGAAGVVGAPPRELD